MVIYFWIQEEKTSEKERDLIEVGYSKDFSSTSSYFVLKWGGRYFFLYVK